MGAGVEITRASLSSSVKVTSLEELFEVANRAFSVFKELMEEFVKNAGLDPNAVVVHKGSALTADDHSPMKVLSMAPLKGQTRCIEKVTNEYGGDWSLLVDVVRCSIVVQTEDALESVAQAMSASNDPRYLLVRLKNRFKEPLFNGYRDALYSLSVCVDGVWHVCEVQLHLAAVIFHKHESHVYYEFFRSYFRGNVSAAEQRMKLLETMGSSEEGVEAMVKGVLRGCDGDQLDAFAELAGDDMMGEYRLLVAVQRRRLQLVLQRADVAEIVFMKKDVAKALQLNCQYNEALVLLRECYATLKEDCDFTVTLGDAHADFVAEVMYDLATLLHEVGKYGEAELLYREVLTERQLSLGRNHSDTLRILNGLGNLFADQAKFDESDQLYRECLAQRVEAFGEDHLSVIESKNNLANNLCQQGKDDEAEVVYRECLAGTVAALGHEHPDSLVSMDNLAACLSDLEKNEEAVLLYRECMGICQVTLGLAHSLTLKVMGHLGSHFAKEELWDEAEPLLRDSFARSRDSLGASHPDTIMRMGTLADFLHDWDMNEEAEPLYREYIALIIEGLGRKHPDSLDAMESLASLLYDECRYDEAERLYRDCMLLRKEIFGDDHADTRTVMKDLARSLHKLHRTEEAMELYSGNLSSDDEGDEDEGESDEDEGEDEDESQGTVKKPSTYKFKRDAIVTEWKASNRVVIQNWRGGDSNFTADYTITFDARDFSTLVGLVRLSKGKFYYETTILDAKPEIMQLGFATEGFRSAKRSKGDGVGDDDFSWAFDGMRKLLWPSKKSFGSRWKQGDVVGFACAMESNRHSIAFSLNGSWAAPYGVAFDNVKAPWLMPAWSGDGRLRVNFGDRHFAFGPPDSSYMSVHIAHLTNSKSLFSILPESHPETTLKSAQHPCFEEECMLYAYDDLKKSWAAGIKGVVKLSEHNKQRQVEVVDMAGKVCLTQGADAIKLSPHVGSDKAWTWTSNNVPGAPSSTVAIKFRSCVLASSFHTQLCTLTP